MPTNIRHQIIAATTLAAVVLYLDRICIAEIVKLDEFRNALDLDKEQAGAIMSAFFFSYALGQVPAGWLSDRFGARRMMPLSLTFDHRAATGGEAARFLRVMIDDLQRPH